jgi:hypothetical protein
MVLKTFGLTFGVRALLISTKMNLASPQAFSSPLVPLRQYPGKFILTGPALSATVVLLPLPPPAVVAHFL